MEKKVGRWTIKGSERVYKDDFVEFWVDEIEGPDGKPGRRAVTKLAPGESRCWRWTTEGFVHLVAYIPLRRGARERGGGGGRD